MERNIADKIALLKLSMLANEVAATEIENLQNTTQ